MIFQIFMLRTAPLYHIRLAFKRLSGCHTARLNAFAPTAHRLREKSGLRNVTNMKKDIF
jgi:hypothetical protein